MSQRRPEMQEPEPGARGHPRLSPPQSTAILRLSIPSLLNDVQQSTDSVDVHARLFAQKSIASQLPTPPAQLQGQQCNFYPPTSRRSGEGPVQPNIPLSQNENPGIAVFPYHSTLRTSLMPPQTPEASEYPYKALAIPPQQCSFHPRSARGSRQMSALSVTRLAMITHDGLCVARVDTLTASRWADEKRARNAEASARCRQRKREKRHNGKKSCKYE